MNNLGKFFTSSGNEKIDDIIQEMHSRINKYDDIIFEWISYSQFKNIKQIGKNILKSSILYSAIWKDGPLWYNRHINMGEYIRSQNKKVALKYLHDLQNINDEFLNEV